MNEMIIIGKSVSTHGIKGELKVISDFEYKDRAYKIGNTIMINNINHKITGVRYHKQYILLEIDNIDNINNVLEYVGYNIYIAKYDLNLQNDEYLLKDLIGMDVYDNNILLGKVIEVVFGNSNNFIKVNSSKDFLIPIIPEYIINVDVNNKRINTKGAKDLII